MQDSIYEAITRLEKDAATPADGTRRELTASVQRVQEDYIRIIRHALSLLVQHQDDECERYLTDEKASLAPCKERISVLLSDVDRWTNGYHRDVIEYLFTRARLVEEIRMFPNFALELLERMTLDQSLAETINWLENAMTGKKDLYHNLIDE